LDGYLRGIFYVHHILAVSFNQDEGNEVATTQIHYYNLRLEKLIMISFEAIQSCQDKIQ